MGSRGGDSTQFVFIPGLGEFSGPQEFLDYFRDQAAHQEETKGKAEAPDSREVYNRVARIVNEGGIEQAKLVYAALEERLIYRGEAEDGTVPSWIDIDEWEPLPVLHKANEEVEKHRAICKKIMQRIGECGSGGVAEPIEVKYTGARGWVLAQSVHPQLGESWADFYERRKGLLDKSTADYDGVNLRTSEDSFFMEMLELVTDKYLDNPGEPVPYVGVGKEDHSVSEGGTTKSSGTQNMDREPSHDEERPEQVEVGSKTMTRSELAATLSNNKTRLTFLEEVIIPEVGLNSKPGEMWKDRMDLFREYWLKAGLGRDELPYDEGDPGTMQRRYNASVRRRKR